MKVLIAGAGGQLGRELLRSAPGHVQVVALRHGQLDISDAAQVQAAFERTRPDAVINAAAYTRVDDAQGEQAVAHAVNETGAHNLAQACAQAGARYLLVSTDFVFDGAQGALYQPQDAPNPQSVYGASKRAGEVAALDAAGARPLVVRTSWLYSGQGGQGGKGGNFVMSMLELMRSKPQLGVVVDQVGSPTWAYGLAVALWRCLAHPKLQGIYHYCDAGVASWYDFALAIQALALERGLLTRSIPVEPLGTEQFPRPAPRPAFSALNSLATYQALRLTPWHWREALAAMLDELALQQHSMDKRAYA